MTRTLLALLAALAVLGATAPSGDEPDLQLETKTAEDFRAMLALARREGLGEKAIAIFAGYRPKPARHPLAASVIARWGERELAKWLAATSEHITGRSLDLNLGVPLTLDAAGRYNDVPAFRWLRKNARRFGFNQAFPGEPWHFTHYLPEGSSEGPANGTVGPGPLGTVVRPSSAPKPTLAEQVLTGAAVGWDAATATVVYMQCWREEGGGDGCAVKWERARDHQVRRELPVFTPGQADTDGVRRAMLATARGQMESELNGVIALPAIAWPAAATTLDVQGETLRWEAGKAVVEIKPRSPAQARTLAVRTAAPWTPRPFRVFRRPGLDVLVMELVHDPQDAFCKGANLVSVFETAEPP